MDHKEFFLKTTVWRLFFIAAIPGAVSMLASAIFGLFDGIFIGNILGDTAFAAINIAFPFVIISFSLSDLVAVGSAVVAYLTEWGGVLTKVAEQHAAAALVL